MQKKIAVLGGDGIGPEVTAEGVKILKAIAAKFGHEFIFEEGLIGACALKKEDDPLPPATLELCKSADAVLLGAVGDPSYDKNPTLQKRPEQGLLRLRKGLGLYANIRPLMIFEGVPNNVLQPQKLQGVDFVVVRELIGGIYFGARGRSEDGKSAFDTCTYSKGEIVRVSEFAFKLAGLRRKKITLVDKANVLETSRLWRETVAEMQKNHPEIQLEYLYVDNAAMQIVLNPQQFDVILTENMFGDILSDEASVLSGSLGMLPSASLGAEVSLYEPIHGSYPQAAGKNIANPLGAILSVAMMLEYSFGMLKEAQSIYQAVRKSLVEKQGTVDIFPEKALSTSAMGDAVVNNITA